MSKEKISIISTLVNLILALLKLGAGFFVKSTALIADGIHSGLDIFSSLVTFLGIKAAKKPADKEHPYGHLRSETIAGFIVVILLLISAIWIIYEGVTNIIKPHSLSFGSLAIGVVIISIFINELMARLKFKIGRQTDNLALIADAEHSRADSISSVAVLVGLITTRWFSWSDGAAAILVGIYIIYESYLLSREVIDSLLDISNPEVESQVKEICQQQEIKLLDLRTRKIGPQNFAELKIGLIKNWRMQKVEEVTTNLENLLREKISSLKFVVIQVVSHELKQGYLKSKTGQIQNFKELSSKITLKKLGKRIIIPLDQQGQLSSTFGAPYYLVIDKKGNQILQKKKMKNPYFVIGRGHGVRFSRELEADEIVTLEIGGHAKESLKNLGIKIKEITDKKEIANLL